MKRHHGRARRHDHNPGKRANGKLDGPARDVPVHGIGRIGRISPRLGRSRYIVRRADSGSPEHRVHARSHLPGPGGERPLSHRFPLHPSQEPHVQPLHGIPRHLGLWLSLRTLFRLAQRERSSRKQTRFLCLVIKATTGKAGSK